MIAKATFAFVVDGVAPRVEPRAVLHDDTHYSKNPARVIRFARELAPHKPRADVVFTGHAHAHEAAPARSLRLRLAVFEGDRPKLDKTMIAQDPGGFVRMPVVYERAFGGAGFSANPFGTGVAPGSAAPTLVDPADPRRPIGFGPLPSGWPSRKRLLGSTPRGVIERPLAEIPDAFDWTYFQVAPDDQRLDALRGDEWVVLEGLHPDAARARMRLPQARAVARVCGLSSYGVSEGQPLDLVADTLIIDSDDKVMSVVWRRSFPIREEAALARVRAVVGVESEGAPLVWPERVSELAQAPPSAPARAPAVSAEIPGETMELSNDVALALARAKNPAFLDLTSPARPSSKETTLEIGDEPRESSRSALPFAPDAGLSPQIAAPSERAEGQATGVPTGTVEVRDLSADQMAKLRMARVGSTPFRSESAPPAFVAAPERVLLARPEPVAPAPVVQAPSLVAASAEPLAQPPAPVAASLEPLAPAPAPVVRSTAPREPLGPFGAPFMEALLRAGYPDDP